MEKGYLVLENGRFFEGNWIGKACPSGGEVVFNTSMTGYQEILTDPSYKGQVVVLTYPLIGNYGIDLAVSQSAKIQASGLILGECCEKPSHWASNLSLEAYLKQAGISGLVNVDTRALTKELRTHGTMRGCMVTNPSHSKAYFKHVNQQVASLPPVYMTTTPFAYELQVNQVPTARVAVMDYGIKQGILKAMLSKGFEIKVFPASTSAETVLSWQPDGIFLSNGPGDPAQLTSIIHQVSLLAQHKPTFGICLGHQLLCHAFGAQTEKLKFGHRGANHPVKDLVYDKVVMTAQNHGYVVVEGTINPERLEVSHYNVNDGSIEGVRHKYLPVFSVQYHPEASPGPSDSLYLFDAFLELMNRQKGGMICA